MSQFFPLQSSGVLACLLCLPLGRQNIAHLLILAQLASLNQNQKITTKKLKLV